MKSGRVIMHSLFGLFVGCIPSTENNHINQEAFAHKRRVVPATTAWGGMRVDWIAVADWPTGDSMDAKAARVWIGDRLRNGGEMFNGDLADWDAMAQFYGNRFLADNGPSRLKLNGALQLAKERILVQENRM